jgi:hypothetical protein
MNRESIFSSIKSSIGAFDNIVSAKSTSSKGGGANKKSMSSEMYRSTVIKAFLEDPRIREMMKKDNNYVEIPYGS